MPLFSSSRIIYVAGDVAMLALALPITLILRNFSIPSIDLVLAHIVPFIIITAVSVIVFFSAGLYDTMTSWSREELPATIVVAQIVNMSLAALLFFFVPLFNVAPKTNLVIYLLVSVVLVSTWRLALFMFSKENADQAIIVGEGSDVAELVSECNLSHLPFGEVAAIPFIQGESTEELLVRLDAVFGTRPAVIVLDTNDEHMKAMMPALLKSFASSASIVDFTDLYERVFRRVPLSTLSYRSFLADDLSNRLVYSIIKRVFDLLLGGIIFVGFVIITPVVALLISLDSKGPIFFKQIRIGKGWKKITILKFRSMEEAKNEYGVWIKESKNRITKVGAFLRKTSIDEIPQVISVLMGTQSLIGPRSDIEGLADRLRDAIPFYETRYRVTPGITGWAQVNQRYAPGNISPQSIEESEMRLAYDLYYVKKWSPFLDFSIALRTIKTLIKRLLP